MNCLASEQIVELALGDAPRVDHAAEWAHVNECTRCAARVVEVQEQMGRLEKAMTWFDRDHVEGRQRLLAALAVTAPSPHSERTLTRNVKEILTMPRTWIGSAAAAALLIGAFFIWHSADPPSLMAQTAQALRDVKSYKCRATAEFSASDGQKKFDSMKLYWSAAGSMRFDTFQKGKLTGELLWCKDKPGLDIDHRAKTYNRLGPMKGATSPLLVLNKLAGFAGQADRQLDPLTIKDKRAPGFEIAVAKIDLDIGQGSLRLWTDPDTKLPLRLELAMKSGTMTWEDFEWNVPTDNWFTLAPPAGYQDKTTVPPGVEEITKDIVLGLKVFAKYSGGKYPQAKMVYGDVTSEELNKNAGLPPRSPPADRNDKALWKVYGECLPAWRGFGQINELQRHDAGAVYHGKTVGPEDTTKVLFRWTLNDGRFRVIYGDLHVEDVVEAKLKMLEKD